MTTLIIPDIERELDQSLNIAYSPFAIYKTLAGLLKLHEFDFEHFGGNRFGCKVDLSEDQLNLLEDLKIKIENKNTLLG
jgi:hypothetical protein